jgi:hypothetical protein
LIDDVLGVTAGEQPLDSQGNSDARSVDQGLVLGAIVGRFVVDLQDVLQMVALGRDEDYACACSFKVQRAIKVHIPVLRLLSRRGLLGLCPLRDEVGEDPGLDGLSWTELMLEFTQRDRPLDDVPHGVAAMQDFTQGEAGDDLDLVRVKVMPQLA